MWIGFVSGPLFFAQLDKLAWARYARPFSRREKKGLADFYEKMRYNARTIWQLSPQTVFILIL